MLQPPSPPSRRRERSRLAPAKPYLQIEHPLARYKGTRSLKGYRSASGSVEGSLVRVRMTA